PWVSPLQARRVNASDSPVQCLRHGGSMLRTRPFNPSGSTLCCFSRPVHTSASSPLVSALFLVYSGKTPARTSRFTAPRITSRSALYQTPPLFASGRIESQSFRLKSNSKIGPLCTAGGVALSNSSKTQKLEKQFY